MLRAQFSARRKLSAPRWFPGTSTLAPLRRSRVAPACRHDPCQWLRRVCHKGMCRYRGVPSKRCDPGPLLPSYLRLRGVQTEVMCGELDKCRMFGLLTMWLMLSSFAVRSVTDGSVLWHRKRHFGGTHHHHSSGYGSFGHSPANNDCATGKKCTGLLAGRCVLVAEITRI